MTIVLDASAIVAPAHRSAGQAVGARPAGRRGDRRARSQPAEVLSAISRLVRADVIDRRRARHRLDEFALMVQELVPPSVAHLARALQLDGRLRVLAGVYVALAEELDCPVVTTGRQLTRADPPCLVRVPT